MLKKINLYTVIYKRLDSNTVTGRLITLISSCYETIYTGDEAVLMKNSVIQFFVMTGLCIISFFAATRGEYSPFNIVSSLFLIKVICIEILNRESVRARKRLLKQLDEFICNMRHHYYRSKSVTDALWESKECADREMRLNGEKLYGILTAEDIEYEKQLYMDNCRERFLRFLLTLLVNFSEEGEYHTSGDSVFLSNLTELRKDIQGEIRHITKKANYFSGFKATAVIPIFAVPFIGSWGVNTVDGMSSFYMGTAGAVLRAVILAVCWLCYSAIIRLREDYYNYGRRENRLAECLLRLRGIKRLAKGMADRFYLRTEKLTGMFDVLSINYSVHSFYIMQLEYAVLIFMTGICVFMYGKGAAYIEIYELLLCMAAGSIAYFVPYISLVLREALSFSVRQEEVLLFNSLIMMHYKSAGVSTVFLLELMEEFSGVFRKSLQQCINEYATDNEMALERLREAEDYVPFRHLADCFIMAEEIGIEAAFEEIVTDTKSFRDNNKMERSILLRDKSYLATLLAIVPGMLVLFGYLLMPFLINALTMFDSYTNQLEKMI